MIQNLRKIIGKSHHEERIDPGRRREDARSSEHRRLDLIYIISFLVTPRYEISSAGAVSILNAELAAGVRCAPTRSSACRRPRLLSSQLNRCNVARHRASYFVRTISSLRFVSAASYLRTRNETSDLPSWKKKVTMLRIRAEEISGGRQR